MKLMLSDKFSSYTTPITKRLVQSGEPFEVTDAEGERLLRLGLFFHLPDDVPVVLIPGFETGTGKFLTEIPEDWKGLNVLIRNGGGIGDCLIASSVAVHLKQRNCTVTMAVPETALGFIDLIREVDTVEKLQRVNERSFVNQFDLILDLSDFLKGDSRTVCAQDFYVRAYEVAGIENPTIMLPRNPIVLPSSKTFFPFEILISGIGLAMNVPPIFSAIAGDTQIERSIRPFHFSQKSIPSESKCVCVTRIEIGRSP